MNAPNIQSGYIMRYTAYLLALALVGTQLVLSCPLKSYLSDIGVTNSICLNNSAGDPLPNPKRHQHSDCSLIGCGSCFDYVIYFVNDEQGVYKPNVIIYNWLETHYIAHNIKSYAEFNARAPPHYT
jgi:hypothetical protein